MCLQQSGSAQRKAQIWEQQNADRLKAEQDALAEQQRQQMLQQEEQRKGNIQTGNASIDSVFAGLGDDWLAKARDTYTGAYMPQLQDQQDQAMDKLKAALAGRGILESSVGAQAIADLEKRGADARIKIGNDALDYSNQLRSKVNDSKNNLYAQSAAAADPSAIARSATGEATSLAQQGALTPSQPLSDVFSSFLTPFVNATAASQNAAPATRKLFSAGAAPVSGSSGSSSIVR